MDDRSTGDTSILDRMSAWAKANGVSTEWAPNDKKRNLWVHVRYSGGRATIVIAASEKLISSVVYGVDELSSEDADNLILVLGLVSRLNEPLSLARFSANTDTEEVRLSVVIPRLAGGSETEIFEALVGASIGGLERWLAAVRQIISTVDSQ